MHRPALHTVAVAGALLTGVSAGSAQTTQTFHACYVAEVGALYVIKLDGLPDECLAENHVEIKWAEGGGVPNAASDHGELDGLDNDDHQQYLLADGTRATTNGFAVTGELSSGGIPAEGPGVRLMWYPGKAAFRAGLAGDTDWNDANSGLYSAAFGGNTTASGTASTAMGRGTTASGSSSVATGGSTTASGTASTAMGRGTTASGRLSVATGDGTLAHGYTSTAIGKGTAAQAYASLVIGQYNVAGGSSDSWVDTDPLFVAGNGTSSNQRGDALRLLKNGDLTIGAHLGIGRLAAPSSEHLCITRHRRGNFLSSCSSSARYKDKISPLKRAVAGALVERLRPVSFRWKESSREDIGLIAEEVAEIEPRLVTYNADGEIEGVKYHHLAAVLVAALQEQREEIDSLRTTVTGLRAENERLMEEAERSRVDIATLRAHVDDLESGLGALRVELARLSKIGEAGPLGAQRPSGTRLR